VSGPENDPLALARYWDIRDAHDSLAGLPGHGDIEPGQVEDDSVLWLAAQQPFLTLSGGDAYPSEWDKAAVALRTICQRHPFVQGNKRTGWLYAVFLLGQLGIEIPETVSTERMLGMMTAVATGQCDDWDLIARILRTDVYRGLYG
jgi:death-on-curing protein